MRYKYAALVEVTLGGEKFLPGKKLPNGWDYQGLYDNGMVSRKKIDDRDPDKEQTTGPIAIETRIKSIPKTSTRTKRRTKSNG